VALCCVGSFEALDDGAGIIELANFSTLTTMLFAVLSSEVATLLANSAPGIAGGFVGRVGIVVLGLMMGFGL
jgi:hypothetical protein